MVGKSLRRDEAGIEPLVMKLLAGIIFFGIALGIGIPLYMRLGAGISAVMSYEVSVNPSSVTIGRPVSEENVRTVSVTVSPIAGYDKTVQLEATPVHPELVGVRITFSPPSGKPEFGSTLSIRVDNTAALGTTTITIRGVGEDGTERVDTLTLKIE